MAENKDLTALLLYRDIAVSDTFILIFLFLFISLTV